MRGTRRLATLIALLIVCAISTIPAFSATTSGSITLLSPASADKVHLQTPVEWTWRSGTYVSRTSQVDVLFTRNFVQWIPVASRVPINNGGITWNTTAKNPDGSPKYPDGFYMMRVVVRGTTIRSTSGLFYLDNTAPTVQIERPSESQIIVEDENQPPFAVIVGTATLEAEARDAFTGIDTVTWSLDEEKIGTGIFYTHNFNDVTPGKHELTAVATDEAGNLSLPHSIEIFVLPGPSAAADPPPVEEPTIPGEDDVPPDTGEVPGDVVPGDDTLPGDTIPGEDTPPGEDDVPSGDDPPVDPSASPPPSPLPSIPEGIPPEL